MYLTESSSPFEPGARPSNSSEARTLMCLSKSGAVMASRGACGGTGGGSSAKAAGGKIRKRPRTLFRSFMSDQSGGGISASSLHPLSCAGRGYGWLCLFVIRCRNPDFLEERLDRLFAAEKFFDRLGDLAGIARLVDVPPKTHSGLLVEITIFRRFEDRRHVGRDRIRPGVTVIT